MDFKKIVSAAMIPTIIIVVVGVACTVVGLLLNMFLPLLGGLLAVGVGLLSFAIQCILLGWTGYSAAKKQGLDILGAALTGALAGLVSGVIISIVSLLLNLVGIIPAATQDPSQAAIGGAATLICGPIMVIFNAIVFAVIGLVLGAIGGFLGQGKKK